MRLVADGLTDREIAVHLYLSPHTVQRHVAGVLDALDLRSRSAAAPYAARHGRSTVLAPTGGHYPTSVDPRRPPVGSCRRCGPRGTPP